MNRIIMEQAITANLGLIRGVVRKTLGKYGAKLCNSDIDDIDSNTVLCLLDGRLDNYQYTTDAKLEQWIGYIAMQRTIDYLRAIKKNDQIDGTDSEDGKDLPNAKQIRALSCPELPADDELIWTEFQLTRRARLRAVVSSLSENDQKSYQAMIQDEYTTRTYANEQGVKESTIHTRRHRLIQNIRKTI